ncbi:hypothetical protein D9M68_914850 [compost metagenome]
MAGASAAGNASPAAISATWARTRTQTAIQRMGWCSFYEAGPGWSDVPSDRLDASGSGLPRVRVIAVKVFFPQRHTSAAEDRIGGSHVKEEVGQGVLEQELGGRQANECFTGLAFQQACLGAGKLRRLQRAQE